LNDTLTFSARERVLMIAPHPDDESIAAGGLLQAALAAGAAVRVLVLTDGDNNPWPQRVIEKRWRIAAADRARWGARRRAEAEAAMRVLGLAPEAMRFLGLPDLGITDLLMRREATAPNALRAELAGFAPDLLVVPDIRDRHPDHSAAFLLAHAALAAAPRAVRMLAFAVHGGGPAGEDAVVVPLDALQRERKRAAIEAHASQMRLSRRRFLRYAQAEERYRRVALPLAPQPAHPLQARIEPDGRLRIRIDVRAYGRSPRGHMVFLVLEGGIADGVRATIALEALAGSLPVRDAVGEATLAVAEVRRGADEVALSLPLRERGDWRAGFVKLGRAEPGLWVFDRCGWQVIAGV
jgi:LmbE family N-acetylglucosaminyl deacetylase